jgi:hypothetical protein
VSFLTFVREKIPILGKSSPQNDDRMFLRNSAEVLRSDFPNPDRVGCPDRSVLEGIAYRKTPLKEIAPWLKHLSICSECFRDVSRLRRTKQVQRTVRLAFAAAAAVVIIAFILIVSGKLVTSDRQQAILDLRNASVSRGVESGTNQPSKSVPTLSRSSKNVSIYLPPGEAGAYELRIIGESGTVVAQTSSVGKAANSSTVLKIKVDLSRATPGLYSLLVKRGATSSIYRIQLR